ncbi:S-adenosylmethionine decarboxylase [Myxococcaceae bacterium GXIMD 01537]
MEVRGPDFHALNEPTQVGALAQAIARYFGAELPDVTHHHFTPQGVSCVRSGGAGAIAIHTWPEWSLATVDVWMEAGRLEAGHEGLGRWLREERRCELLQARLCRHGPEAAR